MLFLCFSFSSQQLVAQFQAALFSYQVLKIALPLRSSEKQLVRYSTTTCIRQSRKLLLVTVQKWQVNGGGKTLSHALSSYRKRQMGEQYATASLVPDAPLRMWECPTKTRTWQDLCDSPWLLRVAAWKHMRPARTFSPMLSSWRTMKLRNDCK